MAKPRMDLPAFVGKLLEEQDGDVLRRPYTISTQFPHLHLAMVCVRMLRYALVRVPAVPSKHRCLLAADHWLSIPFEATVNAKPGSSPFPGVVVFWTSRTVFAKTFWVTAPVGFWSHAFWSLTRNDTRVLTGTSVNVIS